MTTPLPTDWRVVLPYPPSVNGIFRKHKGSHLSAAYRDWRDAAGWELKRQRPAKVAGPVAVTVELCPPDRKRRDLDNAGFKAVLDLLVAHGLIEADDSRIVKEITARWVDAGAPCAVSVRGVLPEVRG